MTRAREMIEAYPADLGNIDREALVMCIDACLACSQVCTACADACLSEEMVRDLVKCIRSDLDCADICATTANVLSRYSERPMTSSTWRTTDRKRSKRLCRPVVCACP